LFGYNIAAVTSSVIVAATPSWNLPMRILSTAVLAACCLLAPATAAELAATVAAL
jgi:hypothetical protein